MKKLEINSEDLKNNIEIVKKIASSNPNKKPVIIGVVKGDGIGLDLKEYTRFLVDNGIDFLAVSNYEEAIELRDAGINEKILLMTPISKKEELVELIDKDIILTVGCLNDLKSIEDCCDTSEKKVNVHLKIDTGLGRYGVVYTNIEEILEIFKECENVEIIGTYTHFSKPIDRKWTSLQFDRFMEVVEKIKRENYNPGILHCSASTAFLKYPNMHLDAVRIGSLFQGRTLIPVEGIKKIGVLKTNIMAIKDLPKGYHISYNKAYKTKRNTRIAVIPIGYMDGFNRNKLRDDYSFKNNIIAVGMEIKKIFKDNNLKVIINNKKYNVIGKLGMYHAIIDITGENNIKVGDIVCIDLPPLQTNEKIRREYV